MMKTISGFNSRLVQLKGQSALNSPIYGNRFNSRLVQLKAAIRGYSLLYQCSFNSRLVQLKDLRHSMCSDW